MQGRSLNRPEERLALACADLPVSASAAQRAEALLREPLDWARLHAFADRHRIGQRVYRHLLVRARSLVPPAELDRAAESFFSRAHRNAILASELLRIHRALDVRGIACIPFKGPLMSLALYGSIAYREYADLDVMIRRPDLAEADGALNAIGFLPESPILGPAAAIDLASEHAYPYVHAETGTRLELHCELAQRYFPFPLHAQELFANAVPLAWNGAVFRTLGAEDALLVASMHGAKHCWLWLDLICCMAATLRAAAPVRWDDLLRRAAALGALRMLLLGLELARELFDAELPAHTGELIRRDRKIAALRDEVVASLFSVPGTRATFVRMPWFHQAVRERLRDRVHYRIAGLTSPEFGDLHAVPLPKRAFALYRLIRPLRVLALYGRSLTGR
ncbi:MAG TPA: nucleotidyltransferase family protein [Candidatus Elarobacter sp.]|nr:nucleotidyltransferase family protein [Candidatus Elarobacter sp.]